MNTRAKRPPTSPFHVFSIRKAPRRFFRGPLSGCLFRMSALIEHVFESLRRRITSETQRPQRLETRSPVHRYSPRPLTGRRSAALQAVHRARSDVTRSNGVRDLLSGATSDLALHTLDTKYSVNGLLTYAS